MAATVEKGLMGELLMSRAAQEPVIPEAECAYGYTRAQALDIFGDLADEYVAWVFHQTAARCEGSCSCETGPHGWVTYEVNVSRFARQHS